MNHYTKNPHTGRRTKCIYCSHEINHTPLRGINGRRGEHLKVCEKYALMQNTFKISEKEYGEIISAGEHDNENGMIMKILPM
jgi:hypothetical protein